MVAAALEEETAVAGERTLLLIAGPSGSGKSHLANIGSAERSVSWLGLDNFYRDEDHPMMPKAHGIIDWDDIRSWNLDDALATIEALLGTGRADIPTYEISLNRSVGRMTLDASEARVVMAEGIFAADVYRSCRLRGLSVRAIWLDRPRVFNFARRLVRDLKEHRKPPLVLLRRGISLAVAEPGLRQAALEAGFEPKTMRQARKLLSSLIFG